MCVCVCLCVCVGGRGGAWREGLNRFYVATKSLEHEKCYSPRVLPQCFQEETLYHVRPLYVLTIVIQ